MESQSELHTSCLPFFCAPIPSAALYISPLIGLYTTPITGLFSTTRATDTAHSGTRRMKLVVPSIGSITHVGTSVSSYPPAPLLSSASIEWPGNSSLMVLMRKFSHALSKTVTKSVAPFSSTCFFSMSSKNALFTPAPAWRTILIVKWRARRRNLSVTMGKGLEGPKRASTEAVGLTFTASFGSFPNAIVSARMESGSACVDAAASPSPKSSVPTQIPRTSASA
mmetsp:Transcript_10368/g.27167  ORF Transcript_10368/g.27167 Transcript_10368/m.27167 type:complete len:224 (+) Transcript_10368:698-1369(+)